MTQGKVYCPSCGIDVEPFVLTGGGEEVVHCSICGLVLEAEEEQAPPRPGGQPLLKTVAIAEDTTPVLRAVAQALRQSALAGEIIEASDGGAFVKAVSQHLKAGKPLSLAILDVEMPVMNGVQAARALRNLEQQLGRKRPVPILFFTTRKCDDRFKAVLQRLQPSSYVNKGASQNPADLAQRVQKVLRLLLRGKGR